MEQLSPLVEKLLSGVHDEELSDSSLDALSSIVSHPDTHKYPNTVKELLKRILNLEPLWNQYMQVLLRSNEGNQWHGTNLVLVSENVAEIDLKVIILKAVPSPRTTYHDRKSKKNHFHNSPPPRNLSSTVPSPWRVFSSPSAKAIPACSSTGPLKAKRVAKPLSNSFPSSYRSPDARCNIPRKNRLARCRSGSGTFSR